MKDAARSWNRHFCIVPDVLADPTSIGGFLDFETAAYDKTLQPA